MCSKYTLPALIPPNGWTGSQDLPEPWNNLATRGVNNLASKLLLALFPPGSPCFRNKLDPVARQKIEQAMGDDKKGLEAWLAAADSAMAEIETRFVDWTEANQHRVSMGECFKHLVVAGNVLLYTPDAGSLRVFSLPKYVVLRDCYNKMLETVVKETVARASLDEDARALLEDVHNVPAPAANTTDARQAAAKTVDLYTHIYWTGRVYRVYQEVCGQVVPKSRGSYPADKCPWLPLRWQKIDGEDYGWGHVDGYLGDITSLDMLTQALSEGSAAAARVLFLKKPGSRGKTKDLIAAPNGGFVEADPDDFKALTLDKYADFRVALERVASLEKSLSFAFLLNTAIQRQGERVTAQEIRYMAQELEDALGGVYSVLAQELQLPYVRRQLFIMAKQKAIPQLPDDIKPVIITGLQALGRGQDLARLDNFMAGVPPEQAGTVINWDEYMRRRGTALSVDTKGLIKSPEEIAAAQQAAQMQGLIAQLGPQAVGALGGIAKQAAANQSKEKIENGKQAAAAAASE